jgi:hypothetical protein
VQEKVSRSRGRLKLRTKEKERNDAAAALRGQLDGLDLYHHLVLSLSPTAGSLDITPLSLFGCVNIKLSDSSA